MAKNNLFLLKLVWKECPGRILAELGVQAFGYLSWVFYSIYFLKYIMSALESGKEFGSIFFFLVGSALIFGAGALLENWFQREYRELSDVALYEKINGMLFHKAANVELECYEDTEFYNKYTLAMKETEVRISAVLQNVSAVFCGVAAGTVVMWNMYRIDHLVVLFVLSPMLGNFVFGRLANKLVFERDKACIPYRRRMEYVNRTVYLADYAKEIRMTNIFNVLRKLHGDGFKGVYGILKKYQGKGSVLSFMQNFFTFFVIFQGVMLYGLYKTLTLKTMELSSFVVLSNAMVTGAWILINLSTGLVGMYQNGRDIREYKTGSYRRLFGTVFQDYRLYGATLAENVRMDTEPSAGEEGDKDNIREALIQSGFEKKLGSLANGLETNLTREFDDAGVNLSGGEAQKVAIARAFYKGSPVIIMDEPSSALDPVSEYYLNEAMMRAAEHKAVIFISHRLSTARMADRIYMFEQGRVIESGSHEELMQRNGKYAQMYRVQAEKYREPQQEFTFDA